MKKTVFIAFFFLMSAQCTSTPTRLADSEATAVRKSRQPGSAAPSTRFDERLAQLGLEIYYANLHAHHYMGYKKSPGMPQPGPCAKGGSFMEDDGRPCRAEPSSPNAAEKAVQVVLPTRSVETPSRSPSTDPVVDYFVSSCDYAAQNGGLDVLYITPHSKNGGDADDEPGDSESSGGSNGSSGSGSKKRAPQRDSDTDLASYTIRHQQLVEINRAYDGKFLCGLGQEVSSISRGNHVNIFGQFPIGKKETEPFFFPAGEFSRFYPQVKKRRAQGQRIVLQMNHPDVSGDLFWKSFAEISDNKKLNDYGLDDFAPVGCYLPAGRGAEKEGCENESAAGETQLSNLLLRRTFDHIRASGGDAYRLIEVVSPGGATTNADTEFRSAHRRTSPIQMTDGLKAYIFYLKMGFALAPTANQDNHFMNYGSANAARTGILARNLSESEILESLDRRQTFASEDRNTKVLFTGRTQSRDVLMGEEIETKDSEIELETGYRDDDAADQVVDLRVYYYHEGDDVDFSSSGGKWGIYRTVALSSNGDATLPTGPAQPQDFKEWLQSGELRSFRLPLKKGRQWVFLEFTQSDLDKVWSAPIFINVP